MKCIWIVLLVSVSSLSSMYVSNLQPSWNHLLQLPTPYPPLICFLRRSTDSDQNQQIFKVVSEESMQQVVLSVNFFNISTRRCTHCFIILNKLSGIVYDEFIKFRKLNTRAYFIIVTESLPSKVSSLNCYTDMMEYFGVTNSVLLYFKVDYKQLEMCSSDNLEQSSTYHKTWLDMVNFMRKDYSRNVQGSSLHALIMEWIATVSMSYEPFEVQRSFAELLRSFCEHVNATLHWHLVPTRSDLKYFSEIVNSEFYIIPTIGSISNLSEHIYEDEFTSTVLLIPETASPSYFNHLLVPFSFAVWTIVLILIFLTVFITFKLRKLFPRNLLFMILFGSSTPAHFLNRAERFVVTSLAVIAFLLSEAYIAKMISFMLNVKYKTHLQTIEEFDASSIPFCFDYERDPVTYNQLISGFSEDMRNRFFFWNDSTSWYEADSCSWIMSYEMAKEFLESKYNQDPVTFRKRFYILAQRIKWSLKTHTISRRAPFVERFGDYQRRTREAGLLQRWTEQVKVRIWAKRLVNSLTVFILSDLLSMWKILLYGSSISFAVFIVEISISKRERVVKLIKELYVLCDSLFEIILDLNTWICECN